MGLRGMAQVAAILPSPKIKAGPGRVVLMTVTHMDQGVMEIDFAGLKKPLEPTASHPLFSEDRKDWAPAGQLRVSERIRTKTGTARIEAIRWKKDEHRVYNIEVETDHSYYVAKLGLLSHNSGPCKVDIKITANPNWTKAQRTAAQKKVDAITKANNTVVTHNPARSGTSASARYKKAGGKVGRNQDVDHVVDLQLGGADNVSNMAPLDSSVNRSLGSRIRHKIKKLPQGTPIGRVILEDP
jgi:hypothetical protein